MGGEAMEERILQLLSAKKGHFLLESGHHGDLWLDLETLCLRPRMVACFADDLAGAIADFGLVALCGPLVEGAFVGLMVAMKLNLKFTYSERFAKPSEHGLFPAGYRIPLPLREPLRGKRVAIVDDVINAGSAVRGTFEDLQQCGANVVAVGALLVLGKAAPAYFSGKGVPLVSFATMPNNLWAPSECPLCASGTPLEDMAAFNVTLPT